jgi:hypothetical protein
MPEEMIEITKAEYDRLVDRDFKLTCLENGGVDNWEWYSESLEDYFAAHDEDE